MNHFVVAVRIALFQSPPMPRFGGWIFKANLYSSAISSRNSEGVDVEIDIFEGLLCDFSDSMHSRRNGDFP